MSGEPRGSMREIQPSPPLRGDLRVPGDKSISHRSVIFSALARGETRITGLSGGEDVERTLAAFQAMGVRAERDAGGATVRGVGLRGLLEPNDVLDCGNSGTSARLLLGIAAGQPFFSTFTGDASLRGRPMARVAGPLRQLGATILGRAGGDRLPMGVQGGRLGGGSFQLNVASAQIKSALMLAGLFAGGEVSVTEPARSRDHTERAFRYFGLPIRTDGLTVTTGPGQEYEAKPIDVPGDISAAAFFMVAASLTPGSDLYLRNIGLNTSRSGVIDALRAMGADITVLNEQYDGLEPVGDIRVRPARLRGTVLEGEIIPRLIDEIPILSVAAIFAEGTTVIRDAAELRVKESDRIRTVAGELGRAGGVVDEQPDGLVIRGPQKPRAGAAFVSHGDHRIAMSMAILAGLLDSSSSVHDIGCIDTSFPGFFSTLEAAQRG